MNLIPFDQTKLMAEAIAKSKLFGIQTAEQAQLAARLRIRRAAA
jgi:hypothetical protein